MEIGIRWFLAILTDYPACSVDMLPEFNNPSYFKCCPLRPLPEDVYYIDVLVALKKKSLSNWSAASISSVDEKPESSSLRMFS